MRIVIFDLEMNQPSNKIIQIGAVFVDTNKKEYLEKFNTYVNPYEPLADHIIALTGITEDIIDRDSCGLNVAATKFWKWLVDCKCGKRLGAWGSDLYVLQKQCTDIRIAYPSNIQFHNFKRTFEWLKDSNPIMKRSGSLSNALYSIGMKFKGSQHNALDDSINTARLAFYMTDMLNKIQYIDKLMKHNNVGRY